MSTTTVTHANWSAVDTPEFNTGFDGAVRERGRFDRPWDLLVDGERIERARRAHHSSADSGVALGQVSQASESDVQAAVSAAKKAFPAWRNAPASERIAMLRGVAARIEELQFELAALISFEIGKNRFEARTEVQEAVELLRFYCDSMEQQQYLVTEYPPLGKEHSRSVARPYGVWAILGPFNFPFALTAGMAAAALVTGNTVVIKPPDLAPASAIRFAEICLDAGLPSAIIHVVCGGPAIGKSLTTDPRTAGVGFTGSMEVGHAIRAAVPDKPVVLEMGGKNPAIVTETADLDVAAEAICRSAYRYSGQKCSACSRALVHESLVDDLADAIFDRATRLSIGVPWTPEGTVGPLIDGKAQTRYEAALVQASRDARRLLHGDVPRGLPDGAFVAPAIAVDLPAGHDLLTRELFVPLLCVQPVPDLGTAIRVANEVPYGLTAGLYSTVQDEIDRFQDEIEAGVLYVNRASGATTGAWVGHQSFGGWKGSGSSGANAHGPYYLQQFVREQSRTVLD